MEKAESAVRFFEQAHDIRTTLQPKRCHVIPIFEGPNKIMQLVTALKQYGVLPSAMPPLSNWTTLLTNRSLTSEDYATLVANIKALTITKKPIHLHLIGMTLNWFDAHDLIFIRLLEQLHKHDIPFNISVTHQALMSRIEDARSPRHSDKTPLLSRTRHQHLSRLINAHLVLLPYSLTEHSVTLYAAKPMTLAMITRTASHFDFIGRDKSSVALATTLQAINNRFRHWLLSGKLHKQFNLDAT